MKNSFSIGVYSMQQLTSGHIIYSYKNSTVSVYVYATAVA